MAFQTALVLSEFLMLRKEYYESTSSIERTPLSTNISHINILGKLFMASQAPVMDNVSD